MAAYSGKRKITNMRDKIVAVLITLFVGVIYATAQTRQPSTATRAFAVKTAQQITDIQTSLEKQPGNKVEDIVPQAGMQTRVAIFHDEKRENDLVELHDGSDDYYYVLDGTATLMLGGKLDDPKEVSPGEWRAKIATGGQKVEIKKGDL